MQTILLELMKDAELLQLPGPEKLAFVQNSMRTYIRNAEWDAATKDQMNAFVTMSVPGIVALAVSFKKQEFVKQVGVIAHVCGCM